MNQIQPPVHVQVNHDLKLLYQIATQVLSTEILSGLLYSDFSELQPLDEELETIVNLIIANKGETY